MSITLRHLFSPRALCVVGMLVLAALPSGCSGGGGGGGGGGTAGLNPGVTISGPFNVRVSVTEELGLGSLACDVSAVGTGFGDQVQLSQPDAETVAITDSSGARIALALDGTRIRYSEGDAPTGPFERRTIEIDFAPDGNSFSGTYVRESGADGQVACREVASIVADKPIDYEHRVDWTNAADFTLRSSSSVETFLATANNPGPDDIGGTYQGFAVPRSNFDPVCGGNFASYSVANAPRAFYSGVVDYRSSNGGCGPNVFSDFTITVSKSRQPDIVRMGSVTPMSLETPSPSGDREIPSNLVDGVGRQGGTPFLVR